MRAAFALVLALGVAACSASRREGGAESAPGSKSARAGEPRVVASNVRFSDYAGTNACAKCHATYVRSWLASPMHNMTRAAENVPVRGPFDGTTFAFKGDTAKLETAGRDRFMTITARSGSGIYRITKVVGGHHREDYVGVPVRAVREGEKAAGEDEVVLPVSFVYASSSLRYKGYSVMVKERPGLRVGPVWRQTCIFCHNTVPYLSTALGGIAGRKAPPYQGEVVDPLLPESERAAYVVTDPRALESALATEMARLGAPSDAPTPRTAIDATRGFFREKHLVETGIGCESCHLGSAEHARDPAAMPSLEPRSAFFEVQLPRRKGAKNGHAAQVNRACARCHQVLFSGYEPTWEGGERRRNPGGSNINSGEARDMLLGACASELSCVGCHDPHASDATARLRAMSPVEKDALCTRCHTKYQAPEALRAHSHHDPGREGGRCISCHMAQKTMGLDGGLTAYHRIGSPTDPERVLLDRPLECALCHQDKSVATLVTAMERWWSKVYDRGALEKLYGSVDANALLATAERGKPHEQGVAYFALGQARATTAVPTLLGSGLRHPYPLVRGYAKRALDAIEGKVVPIDLDAPESELEAQIQAYASSRR